MKKSSEPSYHELQRSIETTTLKLHPSQVHGLICGILCGQTDSQPAWQSLITGEESTPKTHELLQAMYDSSAKQLKDFLFELQLLLPDDKELLPIRAEALTLWCQGFLTGLKLVNIPIVDREPGEMTEAITDIIEIAKMNYEEVIASEEDENAYVELVEYVRMAVILIYQDLRESDSSKKPPTSLNHLH